MNSINDIRGSTLKGINSDSIDQLVLDVFDYVEKINAILTNMETLVSDSTTYFKSESANLFRSRFDIVKGNFPITTNNIISYVDDLKQVKINFANLSNDISKQVRQSATNIESLKSFDGGNN